MFYLTHFPLIFNAGAILAIKGLPLLKKLYVGDCFKIDNQLLEAALTLQRELSIECKYTSVDYEKFMVGHETTTRSSFKCNNRFEHKCEQLSFFC